MSPDIVEKVKGFLMDPVETFRNTRGDDLGEVLKYFIVILIINGLLTGLMAMVGFASFGNVPGMGIGTGIAAAVTMIIATIIGGLIGLFVAGLIIHIFVALLIGGNGIEQTIKAVAYGATPAMLLGWIPLVNFLAAIWALVLYVLGVRELHETTTGKAVVAVILPVIVAAVLLVAVLAAFVAYFTVVPA